MFRWSLWAVVVIASGCGGCLVDNTGRCETSRGVAAGASPVVLRWVRNITRPGGPPALLDVELLEPPTVRVTVRADEGSLARLEPDELVFEANTTALLQRFEVRALDGEPDGTRAISFEAVEAPDGDPTCLSLNPLSYVVSSAPACGNGVVEGTETCDEPFVPVDCPYGAPGACGTECRDCVRVERFRSYCGDGLVNGAGEFCDGPLQARVSDGGLVQTDRCADFNWAGGRASCGSDCQPDYSRCFAVGACPSNYPNCRLLPEFTADDGNLCVLESDGRPRCYGTGALAHAPAGPFTRLSVGVDHACALDDAGTARCWGAADAGETTLAPGPWRKVVTALRHTCALDGAGEVRCFGARVEELGAAPAGPFVDVATGLHFACALRADGGPACWGYSPADATTLPTGGPYTAVFASGDRACWRKASGGYECLGAPHRWLDAQHTQPAPPGPELRDDSLSLSSVVMGPLGLCGVTASGDFYCASDENDPRPLATARVTTMATTCGVDDAGVASCWGRSRAQLVPPERASEVARQGLSGEPDSVCVLRLDGGVACSDSSVAGAFKHLQPGGWRCWVKGDDKLDCPVETMAGTVQAPDVRFVRGYSSGQHACGLRPDESVVCWGANDVGQATVPSESFLAVAVASGASCGVLVGGALRCWGSNAAGRATPPTGSFVAIAGGADHFCALSAAGELRCWGRNHVGQATAPAGPGWVGVTAGPGDGTCAWRADGAFTCWGDERLLVAPPRPLERVEAAWWVYALKERAGPWELRGPNLVTLSPGIARPPWELQVDELTTEGAWASTRAGNNVFAFGGFGRFRYSGPFTLPSGAPFDVHGAGQHCFVDSNASPINCRVQGAPGLPPNVPIRALATSGDSPCAVTRQDGGVVCWGSQNSRLYPSPTRLTPPYEAIVASPRNACARREGSFQFDCWGDDTHGLVTALPGGELGRVTFAEDGTSACALRPDAGATCWGQANALVVRGFAPGVAYRSLSLGRRHGCGVLQDGSLFCFGDGAATGPRNAPPGLDWELVGAGDDFTCAVNASRRLKCWGSLVVDTNE